ncbi:hypothetical protein GS397_04840 [Sphingobium yanoikuyae]|jgi:hypothetical protein|uniref:Conjugal transfer protein TraF n=1 Tax=Sphingobium yanoikuyae TaxID=13690 RepID=A0A6M4G4B6_SPHYA|nr:hypothetical protein [Sphingobium yanoikuyae]QHD66466.1 hypothetical protein GS397_04840 [Sphingobium yanoikuyae]QJR02152.1 hypothetical protein HH800_08055 [Sphingobium yanoikuyae]
MNCLGRVRLGYALLITAGLCAAKPASAQQAANRDIARRAAIHPVSTAADMRRWLSRVPVTRDFPPDFETMLRSQASLYVIEMSTAPGCLPCGDLWTKLLAFRGRYGWQVRTIGAEEAMLRSGRLGLPWVGNPVAWVRAATDSNRMVPIAIGTDHGPNIARNAWLATRMLTGARTTVGVRAMSKFTGIVGVRVPASSNPKGR